MALIIEDGSGVSNSDSYVLRADYIAYALTIGITVVDDAEADADLVSAAIFIGQHEENLKGTRVLRDQSMAYPRGGVVIDGWGWNSDEIPRNLILCQMSLALDLKSDLDLYNPEVNRVRIKERVEGAIAVEYSANGKAGKSTKQTRSNALLSSLLESSGLYSITVDRR